MSKPGEIPKYPRHANAHPSGGYLMNDPEELAKQRGVVWDILKNAAGGVTSGKLDLTSISFPVRIFEPRSYLLRLTDSWCLMPGLFAQAAATSDPVQRMKLVITHAVGGLHNTCHQLKPFNPILGETMQGQYSDGTRVAVEQASHHPPITHWLVHGPADKWRFYGYGQWQASFSVNSVSGGQRGVHIVEFGDERISYNLPDMVLSGMLMGDRIMTYSGTMTFEDTKNRLKCVLHMPPAPEAAPAGSWFGGWFAAKPPSDYFKGTIVQTDASGATKVVSTIEGSWLGTVVADGVPLWEIGKGAPLWRCEPVDDPLPSDCRFREDCVNLAKNDLDAAAASKVALEQKQRRDRALRKAAHEAKAKLGSAAAAAAAHH